MDNWVRSRWLPVAFVLPFLIGGAVLWSVNADGPEGEASPMVAVGRFMGAIADGDEAAARKAVYPERRKDARIKERIARWKGFGVNNATIEFVPAEPNKFMKVVVRVAARPDLNEEFSTVDDRRGTFVILPNG